MTATANEWGDAANAADLQAAAATENAFAFETGSADVALLLHLNSGAYTLQVTSVNGGSGVALVEVYEMPSPTFDLANPLCLSRAHGSLFDLPTPQVSVALRWIAC